MMGQVLDGQDVRSNVDEGTDAVKSVGKWTGGAYFDLDDTLLHGSSEKYLVREWLRRKGTFFLIPTLFRWIRGTVGGLLSGKGPYDAMRNRRYITGANWEVLEEISKELVEEKLRHQIPEEAIERLSWHRNQGHRVVIVSATLQPLADLLGEILGVDAAIASTPLFEPTGPLKGDEKNWRIPRNHGKISAVEQDAKEHGIDLRDCWGYGNASADGRFMQICGKGVAVNPDRGLRKQAKKYGWETMKWRIK